jgi:hypothetical protein
LYHLQRTDFPSIALCELILLWLAAVRLWRPMFWSAVVLIYTSN